MEQLRAARLEKFASSVLIPQDSYAPRYQNSQNT